MSALDDYLDNNHAGSSEGVCGFYNNKPCNCGLLDAIVDLAVLRTRIAELEALTQWQPIETAKDGDLVVLFGGVSYVTVGIVNKSVKKVMSLWTPIPKPPEEKVKVTLTTGEVFILNKSEVVKYQQEHKNAIFAKLEPPEENNG